VNNGKELDLAKYRIEQAEECLKTAEAIVDVSLKTSVNRSYYCIFHSIRAILALDKFDSKKHSGIISAFRQKYIKTGVFADHFSDIIGNAFEIRNDSDYEDFYLISKSEALQQIENAQSFLKAVKEYVNRLTDEEDH